MNYIGPGYYNNEKPALRNERRLKFHTAGFDSDTKRFYKRDEKLPGPGTYSKERGEKQLYHKISFNKA